MMKIKKKCIKLKYYVKNKYIVETLTGYDLVTRKFLAGILYKINATFIKPLRIEPTNVYYALSLDEIKTLTNIYDIEYFPERIEDIRKDLQTPLIIKDKKDKTIIFTDLIKDFKIDLEKRTVNIEIRKEVLPLIKEKFETYLKVGFKYLRVLKTEYAHVLYENIILRANKKKNKEQNVKFELKELKKLLRYPYGEYKTISQFIIKPSLKQFNKEDLFKSISIEPVKDLKFIGRGKKPTIGIDFIFILSDEVLELHKQINNKYNNGNNGNGKNNKIKQITAFNIEKLFKKYPQHNKEYLEFCWQKALKNANRYPIAYFNKIVNIDTNQFEYQVYKNKIEKEEEKKIKEKQEDIEYEKEKEKIQREKDYNFSIKDEFYNKINKKNYRKKRRLK